MKKSWNKIKNILRIWLLSLLVSPFLLLWAWYCADDLLYQLFYPSIQTDNIIDMWENVNTVWQNVFEWSIDITLLDVDNIRKIVETDDDGNLLCHWSGDVKEVICPQECSYISDDNKKTCRKQRIKKVTADVWGGVTKSPSIVVKVTRLLLLLTITLSITMILWNGMSYIIQTWQWKEWKNLVKNIIYIVVWIFIALFSVIIITIIQSVPATIEDEVRIEADNQTDEGALDDREAVRRKGLRKETEMVRWSFKN